MSEGVVNVDLSFSNAQIDEDDMEEIERIVDLSSGAHRKIREELSVSSGQRGRASSDEENIQISNDDLSSRASHPSQYSQEQQIARYQRELFGRLHSVSQQLGISDGRSESGAASTNWCLDVDSVKDELKREKRADELRMKKEREMNKRFMQLQEKKTSKKQYKKKKYINKKTLSDLAKRFDQFFAYQNQEDYKGERLSLRQIGLSFNLGNNTTHKLYKEWMQDPTFQNRKVRIDINQRIPEHELAIHRTQQIKRLLKNNPFLTQTQLCVELNKIEDLKSLKEGKKVEITKTIISRLLKAAKFRKKRVRCVPKSRNTTKSTEKRFEYCSKYKQILTNGHKVYFLDESGINLFMTREKAWSQPKEEVTVNCPISKGKRFSLIAIIDENGLAHWRIIEGTYRRHEYLDFIQEMFIKVNESWDHEDTRQRWLILDNCAIHDKQQTLDLADKHNMNILFLPAYSPQLNPIENWFHQVKTRIRKSNYSGEEELLEVMQRILSKYEDYDLSPYFNGIIKFVEKGAKREVF